MLLCTRIARFFVIISFSFLCASGDFVAAIGRIGTEITDRTRLTASIIFAVAVATVAAVATPPPVSDTVRTACRSIPGLTRDQLDLCQRASDVTALAIGGLDMAVAECQHQFRWHRWNCSSLGNGGRQRNPHYSSTFLHRGKRLRRRSRKCAFVFFCVRVRDGGQFNYIALAVLRTVRSDRISSALLSRHICNARNDQPEDNT